MHGLPHHLDIRDAALDESNLVADFRQIVFFSGREIVEHYDAMAAPDEFVHCVWADEAGAARDEVPHSENPPVSDSTYDVSPEKTAGPRFDTLIVCGEPAMRTR